MIFSRDSRGGKLSGIFLLPRRRGAKHALNGITINAKSRSRRFRAVKAKAKPVQSKTVRARARARWRSVRKEGREVVRLV